jgi:tRNA pseudouridine38-40 synthase
MGLAHYKVILSYNGSDFAGFQRQKSERTVQGEFESALRKLDWKGQSILAAGRTDAGVHARGQVVTFWLDWQHTHEDLKNALNYYLPRDIAAKSVEEVPEDFHPRFDAKSRCYSYQIICQPVRDPINEVFAWRVWPEFDLERVLEASEALIGTHNFSAFGSPTSENGVTIREIFSIDWEYQDGVYRCEICANAFLYHMVRRIVFVLVKIGQKEAPLSLIKESLETGAIPLTGLAPATGLVMKEVSYS